MSDKRVFFNVFSEDEKTCFLVSVPCYKFTKILNEQDGTINDCLNYVRKLVSKTIKNTSICFPIENMIVEFSKGFDE